MEEDLARERSNNTRLDRSARVWRTVAIVAGVLALSAGVAAVVW
jgi:anti-sigma-K factor RskA